MRDFLRRRSCWLFTGFGSLLLISGHLPFCQDGKAARDFPAVLFEKVRFFQLSAGFLETHAEKLILQFGSASPEFLVAKLS